MGNCFVNIAKPDSSPAALILQSLVQEIQGIPSGAPKRFAGCCSGLLSPAYEGLLLTGKQNAFCSIASSSIWIDFRRGPTIKGIAAPAIASRLASLRELGG
jgi:hypothetical protein